MIAKLKVWFIMLRRDLESDEVLYDSIYEFLFPTKRIPVASLVVLLYTAILIKNGNLTVKQDYIFNTMIYIALTLRYFYYLDDMYIQEKKKLELSPLKEALKLFGVLIITPILLKSTVFKVVVLYTISLLPFVLFYQVFKKDKKDKSIMFVYLKSLMFLVVIVPLILVILKVKG